MSLTSNDYGMNYAVFKTFADDGATSYSGAIKTGFGKLSGVFVSSAAGTPTLKLYDSTAASGTVIIPTFTPTSGYTYQFSSPILFQTGLYLESTGSVAGVVVYY
jgi:hypothetical protein